MAPTDPVQDIDKLTHPDGWGGIYDFWFPAGLVDADLETHEKLHSLWLRGGATAELFQFAPLLEAAERGDLARWTEEPLGRLSLIVVLDQFPRGIHAGTPKAYALDPAALALAEEGLKMDITTPCRTIGSGCFLHCP